MLLEEEGLHCEYFEAPAGRECEATIVRVEADRVYYFLLNLEAFLQLNLILVDHRNLYIVYCISYYYSHLFDRKNVDICCIYLLYL